MMNPTSAHPAVAAYRNLLDAWNRRDAGAFARAFAEDGSSVGFDGSQMNGRAEIESALSEIFGSHMTATYVSLVQEIRSLDEHTTLIRAVAGMVPRGQTAVNPALNAIQCVVVVLESGEPKAALLQNTPAAFHGRPQLAEQLTRELTAAATSGELITLNTERQALSEQVSRRSSGRRPS
jgi:uncharacterized protein (TIGR02246 family)